MNSTTATTQSAHFWQTLLDEKFARQPDDASPTRLVFVCPSVDPTNAMLQAVCQTSHIKVEVDGPWFDDDSIGDVCAAITSAVENSGIQSVVFCSHSETAPPMRTSPDLTHTADGDGPTDNGVLARVIRTQQRLSAIKRNLAQQFESICNHSSVASLLEQRQVEIAAMLSLNESNTVLFWDRASQEYWPLIQPATH